MKLFSKWLEQAQERFVVTFHDGDVRECYKDGDELVHVLNSSFRISPDDERIRKIEKI